MKSTINSQPTHKAAPFPKLMTTPAGVAAGIVVLVTEPDGEQVVLHSSHPGYPVAQVVHFAFGTLKDFTGTVTLSNE